ncbi:hypothetical protein [Nocardia tengchongensis]|uniref:hypothetical protein n=1 Tax=Nocardia tengchongensis TaxID=2055889 RepID=UPI0036CBAB84
MKGTVQIRLSGDLADITRILAGLIAVRAFGVTVGRDVYRNRDGSARVYAELSLPLNQENQP